VSRVIEKGVHPRFALQPFRGEEELQRIERDREVRVDHRRITCIILLAGDLPAVWRFPRALLRQAA